MASRVDGSTAGMPRGTRNLLRLSGILAFLGFLAYGAMVAGFALEDHSYLEALGGLGWGLVALAVLVATFAVTRREGGAQ